MFQLSSTKFRSSPAHSGRSLAIFDARVDDLNILLSGLRPGVDPVILHPSHDGIQQISTLLARGGGVRQMHVVPYEESEGLLLGTSRIDGLSLRGLNWRDAFTKGAEVFVHGCKAGAGTASCGLVAMMSTVTGATVRMTEDPVGSGMWPQQPQGDRRANIAGNDRESQLVSALPDLGEVPTTSPQASLAPRSDRPAPSAIVRRERAARTAKAAHAARHSAALVASRAAAAAAISATDRATDAAKIAVTDKIAAAVRDAKAENALKSATTAASSAAVGAAAASASARLVKAAAAQISETHSSEESTDVTENASKTAAKAASRAAAKAAAAATRAVAAAASAKAAAKAAAVRAERAAVAANTARAAAATAASRAAAARIAAAPVDETPDETQSA